MRKIYGIGETVLDIIFKNGHPQAAKAGGSVLNSVVSMGRMNLPVSFISEYGKDEVGSIIDLFLKENGVDTSFVYRYKDGNTSLALAFLNEKNDAKYSFYKNYPGKRLDVVFPGVNENDIVQCGSFYAIWPEIRNKFRSFLMKSKERGAMILYDPNFRKFHLSDLDELKPMIIENMEMAEIIRGSDEDFRNIFGVNDVDSAWQSIEGYCKCLVYTANEHGVHVRTSSFSGSYPVNKIVPVSTIGAGDNFNAGMITSFYRNKIEKNDLQKLGQKEWSEIIGTAVAFATHVCLSYENYVSVEFAMAQGNSKYL
ncbi:MAG TPA: PfkB family carbohydrate kinase [Bacteroidales bacterium]|nr:PfkB family carbohydrate kinase [Bacteroidales bacterium]